MPLEYETRATRGGPSVTSNRVATWAALSAVVGTAYWRLADFNAYYYDGPIRVPKFEMPTSWQIAESAFVGALVAGVIVALAPTVQRLYRKWAVAKSD